MAKPQPIKWLSMPEEKDFLAAHSFLSMLVEPDRLDGVVDALRGAPEGNWAAKDLLRAAGLQLLRPKQSTEVAEKLSKIKAGVAISPVLLVGGIRDYLVIADGYHRVCAAHRVDEDTRVPGRLLWRT
jgi:hypothetical protein